MYRGRDPDDHEFDIEALKHDWGAELRRLRKAKGWSCERLARMTTFTTSTLSYVERGVYPPSDVLRMQLAMIFETTVEQLFPYPAPSAERIAS